MSLVPLFGPRLACAIGCFLLLVSGCGVNTSLRSEGRDRVIEQAERDASVERLSADIDRLRPAAQPLGALLPSDWLAQYYEPGETFREYIASDPIRPDAERRRLYVDLLGEFTPTQRRIVAMTARYLEEYFNLPVVTGREIPLSSVPSHARRRRTDGAEQILTTYVLDSLLYPTLPPDAVAAIALTATDLWPGEGWNFMFGQASLVRRVGVWSLNRFGDPDRSDEEFRLCVRRTVKTAAHETGHMFSMKHCIAWRCVMNGSNTLDEADRHPLDACPECMAKICWLTAYEPRRRYRRLAELCGEMGLDADRRVLEMYAGALRR